MNSVVLGCKMGVYIFLVLTLVCDAKWKSKGIGAIKHHKDTLLVLIGTPTDGAYQEGKYPADLQDENSVLEKIWNWERSQQRKETMDRFILKNLRRSVEECKERKSFYSPTILISGAPWAKGGYFLLGKF